MKRTLWITHLGTERSAELSVKGPFLDDSQWFCEWSCEILHPLPKRIYGSDQISALYYCLSFIGAFIREMETGGYGVRHETEGDHGGFVLEGRNGMQTLPCGRDERVAGRGLWDGERFPEGCVSLPEKISWLCLRFDGKVEGLYSILMRLVLPMLLLLLVRGGPCAGAEGDRPKTALMNGSRSGGDNAGEVLFAAQANRGSQVNFLPHLLKRTPEPGAEPVEVCGNASDPDKMLNPPDKWMRLAGLDDAKKAAALGPDDPLLLLAYAELFMTSFDGDSTVPKWHIVAANDLHRRGDAATPRLLWLFDVHPSQQFREGLMFQIDSFPTIRIEPYVAAARNCWWTLGMKTPPLTCRAISRLLSRHGAAEDLKILEEMKKHPQGGIGAVIQNDIERMVRRLKAAGQE